MLKKYELFEITTDVTIRKLRHRGTDKLYLSMEELIDDIHMEHLSISHRARERGVDVRKLFSWSQVGS